MEPDLPRLVAVVGAKGGCGATLLAVNFAAELASAARSRTGPVVPPPGGGGEERAGAGRASRSEGPPPAAPPPGGGPVPAGVGLLDMDFFKGDVAGALDLWPSRTMQEVVAHPDRIDDALLLGTATPHRSGLQVLAQPHDLAEAVQVGTPEVDRLVSAARSAFERCVFDCGSRMDEVAAATALRADLVVIVASPEVAALRNAGRSLDLLRGLGVPNARLRLVVTRLPRRSPVSLDDATRHLGFRIAATIVRNDDVCARADATGQTLKEVDPRADVTRDLGALWSRLTGAAPEPAAAPGWGFLRVLRG